LKFLDSHISEICGFSIANWAQEFADLHAHLCKFATVVNHTGSKFAAGVNDTGGILPLVSTTPTVNCHQWCTLSCEYFRKFWKNSKQP
jgi:hypothetical protein